MTRATLPAKLAGLVLVGLAVLPAAADRLHLEHGGVIETPRWWIEGDRILYESAAGTVGLPRDVVVRIEEAASPNPAPTPGRDSTPPPPQTQTPAPWETRGIRDTARAREKMDLAVAALENRDYQEASSLFLEVFQLAPEANGARVGYAVCELKLGRDERALPVVLEGLSRERDHAELRELLGDLRNREEFVDDAVREWEAAYRLSPSERVKEKILKGQRELQAGRDYEFTATAHFNFRYDGELDDRLFGEIEDYLEDAYRDISYELRHAPGQPITVILYPDREFRAVTGAPDMVAGLYDGKIRVPLGGLSRLDPRAERLLAHELTHAIVHSKTRGNCPRWLHEGLAQRMEGQELTRSQRFEVKELLRSAPADAWDEQEFSYPAARSLVGYLEQRSGLSSIVALLAALEQGRAIDDALHDVFGEGYAAVCRRWASTVLDGRS